MIDRCIDWLIYGWIDRLMIDSKIQEKRLAFTPTLVELCFDLLTSCVGMWTFCQVAH